VTSIQAGRPRDLVAILVVAVACPVALFGGSMLGCLGQGFSADCALNALFIAPLALLVAGIVAGIVTRGWTGMLAVVVGVIAGMSAILVLSFGVGRPVPVDPISGLLATTWFLAPVAIGYGMGRLVWRLMATRDP
jgi:hypothetical protein